MRGKIARFGPQIQVAVVCLLCLWVWANVLHSNGSAKSSSGRSARSYSAGLPFVIADLDGDRRPDLAFVEMASQRSAKTNYSIRLQFGAGTESSIGVSAPFGGLRVAARDVNGDDRVDLILTSNLDAGFLKVLLNDGHGNFSVAAPGTYAELEKESDVLLNGPTGPVVDQTTLASLRSSFGEEGVPGCDCHRVCSSDSVPVAKNQTALRQVAHARLGRSPPVLAVLS